MSKIYSFAGDDDFCSGGSFYTNPKDTSHFLSLGRPVDVYFPPSKRSRVSAPFVFHEVQKKQPSIDVLPDECLFEILRRLPGAEDRSTCASVSKRWLMLISNIRTVELSIKTDDVVMSVADSEEIEDDGYLTRSLEGKKATDTRLAAVAVGTAGRGGLGKLLIRGTKSTRLTSAGFRAVARGCPSLRVLSLWNLASLGDEGLLEIAAECHQLEKLDLCKCPKISDKSLVALARSCPNLTEVTIESCTNIGNGTLQALGQFCPDLKSVSISNCPMVGDQGITSLFSQAGHVLTKLKLQVLNITDVSLAVVGHYGKAITDLVLTRLQSVTERGFWIMGNGHGLQKLKSLAVTYCLGVTDLGLEAVGRGCPNLKQLSVRACPFLSDNGLVSFMKESVSLEGLYMEECHRITQVGLFGLLANSKHNLKTLSLKSLFGIKDFDLELPMLSACSNLRSLSICNCPGFGNSTLSLFGRQCSQIEQLDLSGLEQITDAGFLPLVENCSVGIVKANLSGCSNLTDNAVSALVQIHGSTLEVLNLDGCSKISDISLVAVAEKCLFLNELDISKCRITDLGLEALVGSNQLNLQILSLSECSLISDKSVPALKKLGRSLLGLNLQNCRGISSWSIDSLVEQLWRCDILS